MDRGISGSDVCLDILRSELKDTFHNLMDFVMADNWPTPYLHIRTHHQGSMSMSRSLSVKAWMRSRKRYGLQSYIRRLEGFYLLIILVPRSISG